jgi:hypothetical protein
MSIYSTARGQASINQDRIVVDMSKKISLLKPRVYPLTTMLMRLSKQPTHNTKFEWLEDDLMARWTELDGAITNVATSVSVASGTGSLIAVNDLIKITSTGEVMLVTAVSTDTLTVTRGYGTTAAAAAADEADVLIMGNAMAQGSGASAEKYSNTVTQYNYTQIFKTPFATTNTLEAIKLYGDASELARLRMKKGIEHGESIEYGLLFGERKQDLTGSQPRTTTAGLAYFIQSSGNVANIDTSALTKAEQVSALNNWMEGLFTYGSDVKVAFCSADMLTWLNGIEEDKLRIINSDNDATLGLTFTEYQTVHGKVKLVQHPLLVQGYASRMYAVDLEELSYRPLNGRDTKLQTNIQNNDEDGRKDQYLTEAGLQAKQAKKHGLLTLTNF